MAIGKNKDPFDVSDEDIYEAMKEIPGYLDITPRDFRDVYQLAYHHALARITTAVTAKDVMTANVLFVKRETPVADVAEIMAENNISGVPVIADDHTVAGIISEKDFLFSLGADRVTSIMRLIANCLKNKGCLAVSVRARTAGDIMRSPAITVLEETPLSEIARLFNEKRINRVPVTDAGGRMTGIVSRADIVRFIPGQKQ